VGLLSPAGGQVRTSPEAFHITSKARMPLIISGCGSCCWKVLIADGVKKAIELVLKHDWAPRTMAQQRQA